MFIAHLPAGYLLARQLLKKIRTLPVSPRAVTLTAMAGAVAPDLDMLYFYLIDNGQTHHHKYLSHWPILWIGLLCVSWLAMGLMKRKPLPFLALIFSVGGLLHILLDSVVGDIWWLAPIVDQPYALFTVPARFQPWWLNFVLHWSFFIELLITVRAARASSSTTPSQKPRNSSLATP
ncbi:metal-dependent hydrolase [Alcanivorax sp.]|uniref:metal-dependent hydrolase n=1 Tax=Alcanivorax sp. TaxID=1872427 RepID=UPI000C6B970B|nr:metal-dependent hydrolase [Alcanivorax sp.]MBU85642.1 hydrolase [Alcanivorax sp.]MEE3388675.1 metal-dependent hydrolase [Pseudomonadota bacterium]